MRHFYVHDGGVTVVANGQEHEYPVDVLKAMASKLLAEWSEKSGEGLTALRRARSAADSFPAIPSCQRFVSVLNAANGMADTTMVALQDDLEFYALNLDDCARIMELSDLDSAELIEQLDVLSARGTGLSVDQAWRNAEHVASQAVGDIPSAAEAEVLAAGGGAVGAPGDAASDYASAPPAGEAVEQPR